MEGHTVRNWLLGAAPLTLLLGACSSGGSEGAPLIGGDPADVTPSFRATSNRLGSGAVEVRSGFDLRTTIADIDGDGILDVVATADTASILWGDRAGSHTQITRLDTSNVRQIVAADFDGDGDVDLATSVFPGSQFVWRNEGGRQFPAANLFPWVERTYGVLDIQTMKEGDFDRDGDIDIVFALSGSAIGNLLLSENLGGGAFAVKIGAFPFVNSTQTELQVGDLNGDGSLDVVSLSSSEVRVWRNRGDGTFDDSTAATLGPVVLGGNVSVAAYDPDGDGDLDLAIAQVGQISRFRNDGSGVFTAVPAEAVSVSRLFVGDADGDGRDDLVSVAGTEVREHLQDPSGALSTRTANVVDSGGVRGVAPLGAGDTDGDGVVDLLIPDPDRFLALTRSDAMSTYQVVPSHTAPFALNAGGLAVGDANGDGLNDLVVWTLTDSQPEMVFTTWVNDGRGQFSAGSQFESTEIASEHVSVADVTGDGLGDLLTALGLHRGSNAGFASVPEPWAVTGAVLHAPLTADFDGDGDVDVGLLTSTGLWVLTADSGAFTRTQVATGTWTDVAVTDANADGIQDLVVVGERVLPGLYVGAVGGQFVDSSARLSRLGRLPNLIASMDHDGDGDEDLLAGFLGPFSSAGSGAGQAFVLVNEPGADYSVGTMIWDENSVEMFSAGHILDWSLGDIEGDGDVDLFLTTQYIHQVRSHVYLHRADHSFTRVEQWRREANRNNRDMKLSQGLVDLDGDQDLDVVFATSLRTLGTSGWAVLRPDVQSFGYCDHRAVRSFGTVLTGHDYVVQVRHASTGSTREAALLIGTPITPVPVPGIGALGVAAFASMPIVIPANPGHAEVVVPIAAGSLPTGFEIAAQAVFLSSLGLPASMSITTVDVVIE